MNEIALGPIESFDNLPKEVKVEQSYYWLVQTAEGGHRLLNSICPHAGGEVQPMNGVLLCPLHFWTFDAVEGTCLNYSDEKLMRRDVLLRDGTLYAIGEDY